MTFSRYDEHFFGHFVLVGVEILVALFAVIMRRRAGRFAPCGNFRYKVAVSMTFSRYDERFFGRFVLIRVEILVALFAVIMRRRAGRFAPRGNFGDKVAVSVPGRSQNYGLPIAIIFAFVRNGRGHHTAAVRLAGSFNDNFASYRRVKNERGTAVLVGKRDISAVVFRIPMPNAVFKIVNGFDRGFRHSIHSTVYAYRIVKGSRLFKREAELSVLFNAVFYEDHVSVGVFNGYRIIFAGA